MAIAVKLKCSECSTVRQARLTPEDKEIVCPACGRRLQNLTAQELGEIETVQKKQLLFSIISVVLLVIAAVCVGMWVGESGTWPSADARPEANAGFFFGAIICAVASMVLGILGSMKRFVVEF
jgi:DNA-directed RNA polymerase subunit RPC12/RpoP/ABC-type multidrug transport system fused ATPase/permease subunit